ncbi:hypothetical protein BGW80DRAFT_1360145, partial [Lactifluus volemus]
MGGRVCGDSRDERARGGVVPHGRGESFVLGPRDPIVRWLVRRAKIVDMVHRDLKAAFSLPYKIETL